MSWLDDFTDNLGLHPDSGDWTPAAFIVLVIAMGALVYLIYRQGRSDFAKNTYKQTPYFSGNEVPDKLHIRGTDNYWGFRAALQPYYERIIPMHSGNVNDYTFWFVTGLALAFVILVVW